MNRRSFLLLAGLLMTIPSLAREPQPGDFITDGPPRLKRIALTFDDGPGPDTEKFLELFDRYHVKVTFFVLGELAGYHPDIVKKADEKGHEIGSHTYNHINYKAKFKEISQRAQSEGRGENEAIAEVKADLLEDMQKSDRNIQRAIGHKIFFCRMPNGIDRPWIKQVAKEMDYALVNWTYGADWTPKSYEQLLPGYLKAIRPGAILLLHDGGKDRSKTLALTEAIIQSAQKKGFEIVPVGKLLSQN